MGKSKHNASKERGEAKKGERKRKGSGNYRAGRQLQFPAKFWNKHLNNLYLSGSHQSKLQEIWIC